MSKRDGGPAFPQALGVDKEFVGSEGMSLRDYFAGQALAGFLASFGGHTDAPPGEPAARRAFQYADAMLAERAKAEQP